MESINADLGGVYNVGDESRWLPFPRLAISRRRSYHESELPVHLQFALFLMSICLVSFTAPSQAQSVYTISLVSAPQDLAVDSSRNIYVCDPTNYRIIKLSLSGTVLATFVPTPRVYPLGIAVDTSNNIYFTDSISGSVIKLSPTGTVIGNFSTVNPRLASPYDVAVDGNGNMFVADTGNDRAVKLSSTGAQLYVSPAHYFPYAVGFDNANDLYMTTYDNYGDSIYKYTAGGVLAYQYSTSNPVLSVSGIAIDGDLNVYAADYANSRLIVLNTSGSIIRTYNYPAFHVTLDAQNNIFLTTRSSVVALIFNSALASTGSQNSLISSSGASSSSALCFNTAQILHTFRLPSGLALDSGNNLYVTDYFNNQIIKYSPSGNQLAIFTTSSPALNSPYGITVDAANNLYIADGSNSRVVKLLSSGIQSQIFTTTNPAMYGPTDVKVDSAYNVYVVDTGNNRIVKFSSSGVVLAKFSGNTPMTNPTALALDVNGNLYITDTDNARIIKLSSSGVQLAVFTTVNPALNLPDGIAVDRNNNIYVSDRTNNRVVQLSSTGVQTAVFTAPTTSDPLSGLGQPLTIVFDTNNNMYVADAIRVWYFPAGTPSACSSGNGNDNGNGNENGNGNSDSPQSSAGAIAGGVVGGVVGCFVFAIIAFLLFRYVKMNNNKPVNANTINVSSSSSNLDSIQSPSAASTPAPSSPPLPPRPSNVEMQRPAVVNPLVQPSLSTGEMKTEV